MIAFDHPWVIAAAPVVPLIVVGPVAVSVQSVATAVPPLSFVPVFCRVSVAVVGALSSLLMVQVALSPSASVMLDPTTGAPPLFTQLQLPAV